MSETLVEIRGLVKRFDSVPAVDDVSLELVENEFFALLGPSGCGKTTLLRLIAGFEVPDRGTIVLGGRDLAHVKPNKRPVNMMFQSYALFPHLNVWDNVAYGLRMERQARAAIGERVARALEMVQLGDVARRRPEQLSGGQKQRVALARALIKRPRLLLLDEPLAALDRKLRGQMQFELKRLQHEVGITFMVVTHDQEEALAMADRIALLDRGRIAQLGAARELYEQPRSRFVADFIGTMNFIAGTAREPGVLEAPGAGRLRGIDRGVRPGGPAWLAVRPEKIRIDQAPPDAGDRNSLGGRLEGTTYMGQGLKCFVRVAGCGEPLVVHLSRDTESVEGLVQGARVWCSWPVAASHILD